MTTDHTSPVTPVTVPDADNERREQVKQRNKDFVADVAKDTADAAAVAAADAADASATAASKAADVTTDAAAKVAATATEVTSKVQDAVAPTASKASAALSGAASDTVAAVKSTADRVTTPDPALLQAQEVALAVTDAAQQVPGVYRLGGLAAGALASMRYRVSGAVSTPGVSTAVGPDGAARVDLRIVISYPAGIPDVVAAVREQVLRAASEIVSGPVQVDITVADVHGPFDPIDPPAI